MRYSIKDSKHSGNSNEFTGKVELILKLFMLRGIGDKLIQEITGHIEKMPRTKIQAEDVGIFLHRASLVYNKLIKICPLITYPMFCEYLAWRYNFDKAHAPGEYLALSTILSYFKRERAGESRRECPAR